MSESEKRPAEQAPLTFLAGGGEMGERICTFDWSQTPLGPAASWSPALRTMVRLMLANRLPMLLWWGPEYVSIYNDPYRPVLGNKHPWALGQRVSECWKEIWHVLQPLIDTPYHGGPATWDEDILLVINRHGFVEETHWLIAYSPVPDESVEGGSPGSSPRCMRSPRRSWANGGWSPSATWRPAPQRRRRLKRRVPWPLGTWNCTLRMYPLPCST
jgi:hypothetical protein